jgi:hypothetical protein
MTDEQKLETEEQEDVEAHAGLNEPALERERADDEADEVEGHAAFGPFAPDEPAL